MTHLEVNDNKLSMADTSDVESDSEIWFWNESANETNSDSEEEENDGGNESDTEEEERKTNLGQNKQLVVCTIFKKEVKWNREGEDRVRGNYGKGPEYWRCPYFGTSCSLRSSLTGDKCGYPDYRLPA